MDDQLTITVDGRDRSLVTVTGPRSEGGAVFLGLHGSNQSASGFRKFTGGQFDRLADLGVVGYLDGYRGHWNDARRGLDQAARRDGVDDVAFVRAAIAELAGRYRADPARTYVFGYSNGGAMVLRLLLEIGADLAGAGVVSATMPAPENRLDVDAGPVPVPLALVHGTRDKLVPYEGGMASLWGLRPRGLGLSAEDTARFFADRYGIDGPVLTQDLGADGGTVVTRLEYGTRPAPVVLYKVDGGGHTVPGPHKAPLIMGRTSRVITAAEEFARVWGLTTP
jgi:polyhydroxybutyrate depolymerase